MRNQSDMSALAALTFIAFFFAMPVLADFGGVEIAHVVGIFLAPLDGVLGGF